MKTDLDAKRASGVIHYPNEAQAKMINAVIKGLASFDDPVLQSVSRMLARRTILVDESLTRTELFTKGMTTPTIRGYENIIRLNPERIADPMFFYKDGNGVENISYALLQTMPHENLHLVFNEMGFPDPGGKWMHDNIRDPYNEDILKRVLYGKPIVP
jgi:hypothetical protein